MSDLPVVVGHRLVLPDDFVPEEPIPAAVLRDLPSDVPDPAPDLPPKWQLKELKPVHRHVASLYAQGFKRQQISAICDITPEYVTMLIAQPLVKEYIAQMCAIADTQVNALVPKSVDVLADVLSNGTEKGKLTAVRTVLEVTKRIGAKTVEQKDPEDQNERLARLSEKLLDLQASIRTRSATRIDPNEDIIDV